MPQAASDFDPTSHADFGAGTHPGVGGGTHRRRATFERCSVFMGGVCLGGWGVVLVVCVCVGVRGVVRCRRVCVCVCVCVCDLLIFLHLYCIYYTTFLKNLSYLRITQLSVAGLRTTLHSAYSYNYNIRCIIILYL